MGHIGKIVQKLRNNAYVIVLDLKNKLLLV